MPDHVEASDACKTCPLNKAYQPPSRPGLRPTQDISCPLAKHKEFKGNVAHAVTRAVVYDDMRCVVGVMMMMMMMLTTTMAMMMMMMVMMLIRRTTMMMMMTPVLTPLSPSDHQAEAAQLGVPLSARADRAVLELPARGATPLLAGRRDARNGRPGGGERQYIPCRLSIVWEWLSGRR
jgi:hypothetical protein